jgi:Uma2 family endonuclease
MTVATQRTSTSRMTLEEFLNYDDGTENRYELVDGVLVEVGNEAKINTKIAIFLIVAFARLGLETDRIGIKQMIQVKSNFVSARDPDLIVHSAESAALGEDDFQVCLKLNEPNPLIVIEVVSPGEPGTPNYDRDYKRKATEYAARGIPEYWIIDPASDRAWVKVGTWVNGQYEFQTFTGKELILSPSFLQFNLTAEQILTVGR